MRFRPGSTPPALANSGTHAGARHFLQSLLILDETGDRIRYDIDADGNRTGRTTNFVDQ